MFSGVFESESAGLEARKEDMAQCQRLDSERLDAYWKTRLLEKRCRRCVKYISQVAPGEE